MTRAFKTSLGLAAVFVAFATNGAAVSVQYTQSSLFLSIPGSTYQDDQLGWYDPIFAPRTNNFGGGFSISYYDDLDTNNFGEITWLITNNTGAIVADAYVSGFLDAEVGTNQFWDEYGSLAGDVDGRYDSWEIDEPGYVFGDIYDNLLSGGVLDNSNSLPKGSPASLTLFDDDVSLGLGFAIRDWMAGETIMAKFLISEEMPDVAALAQHDAVTEEVFYFSGEVSVVPLPGSAVLMLSGLMLLMVKGYRRKSMAVITI